MQYAEDVFRDVHLKPVWLSNQCYPSKFNFKKRDPTSAFFLETTMLLRHVYFPCYHNKFKRHVLMGIDLIKQILLLRREHSLVALSFWLLVSTLSACWQKYNDSSTVWCHCLHARTPVLPTMALHYQCKLHFRNIMKIVWPCDLLGSVLGPQWWVDHAFRTASLSDYP